MPPPSVTHVPPLVTEQYDEPEVTVNKPEELVEEPPEDEPPEDEPPDVVGGLVPLEEGGTEEELPEVVEDELLGESVHWMPAPS